MDKKELIDKSQGLFNQHDERAEAARVAAEGEPEATRRLDEWRSKDQQQHSRVTELIQNLGHTHTRHIDMNKIWQDKSPTIQLFEAPDNEHGFEHIGVRVEQDFNEGWPGTKNDGRRTNSRQNRIVYVAYGADKEEILVEFETHDRGNGWSASPFHGSAYDIAQQYEGMGLFSQQDEFERELEEVEAIVATLPESQSAA